MVSGYEARGGLEGKMQCHNEETWPVINHYAWLARYLADKINASSTDSVLDILISGGQ